MQQAVEELADRTVARYRELELSPGSRILVGVAGVPGAGKSTLAFPLTERINEKLGVSVTEHTHVDADQALATPLHGQAHQTAISVSLDGWHSTRAALDRMPDPAEARRRRGAAFTFDANDYCDFIRALKERPARKEVAFRAFSHAKKDPEPGPFPITPEHRIIIIEGLYCLLSSQPWKEATDLLDERIWVDCPDEVAKNRLIVRHVATGVENDTESARKRVEGSDMHNGTFIRQNLAQPTAIVESVLDEDYAKDVEERIASQS